MFGSIFPVAITVWFSRAVQEKIFICQCPEGGENVKTVTQNENGVYYGCIKFH